MSSSQPSDAPDSNVTPPATKTAGRQWQRGPLVGLSSTLAAGLLVWLVIQAVHPVFMTEEGADEFGFLPLDVQRELDRNNAMFVLAVLGGLASMGLVVGEGLNRKSWKTVLLAAIGAGGVGIAFGGLAGYLGHVVYELHKSNDGLSDLVKAIQVQGVMLATVGAGAGLIAGALLGGQTRTAIKCLITGFLAGALAAAVYPMIVALLMPSAMTTVLIPLESGERLLWCGLTTGLLGALLPTAAAKPTPAGQIR